MKLFSSDDKAPPPSYEKVTAGQSTLDVQQPPPAARRSPSPSRPPPQYRFPQSFGFYSAGSLSSDMYLSPGQSDPTQLNYISIHGGFSSQPPVVLHSSRDGSSPPIATADFRSFSNGIDITLFVGIPPGSPPQTCAMEATGMMTASRMFQAPIPSTGKLETFEWKGSSGPEVQMLDGRSHGKKCVRVSTGEVVAVFTHPGMSFDKRGKMAFVADRASLGEAFEILAVVGVAAMIEKERRARRSRNNRGVNNIQRF